MVLRLPVLATLLCQRLLPCRVQRSARIRSRRRLIASASPEATSLCISTLVFLFRLALRLGELSYHILRMRAATVAIAPIPDIQAVIEASIKVPLFNCCVITTYHSLCGKFGHLGPSHQERIIRSALPSASLPLQRQGQGHQG